MKIEKIELEDGKYTLIMDPRNMRALRYGEEWRSLIGDNLVAALGNEILFLREKVAKLEKQASAPQDAHLW